MSNMAFILASIVMGAIGQVLIKAGANNLGSVKLDMYSIISLITNFYLFSGICLFSFSFILWIKVLTKNDLSCVYPMVSLSYIIVVLASKLFFNEAITTNKLIGILAIIIGIIVINK